MTEGHEAPPLAGATDDHALTLDVLQVHGGVTHEFLAAPINRVWMDLTPHRFANRCLPLLIANQAGWLLINPTAMVFRWDGGRGLSSLTVQATGSTALPLPASSHFGQGIVTWHVPYVFRTPPGWNLLVRGPSNCPMDGIYPLEGLVESDWSAATFTMNWQLTRPGLDVQFPEGEPYAMLVPQRRGDLEAFRPVVRRLAEDPELESRTRAWAVSRERFNAGLASGQGPVGPGWQRDYFQGTDVDGRRAGVHQRRLHIQDPEWRL